MPVASNGLRLVVVSNVNSFLTSSSWEPTPGKTDFTNRSKGVVLSTTKSAPVELDAMRVARPVRGRLVGVTLGFENNPNILSHKSLLMGSGRPRQTCKANSFQALVVKGGDAFGMSDVRHFGKKLIPPRGSDHSHTVANRVKVSKGSFNVGQRVEFAFGDKSNRV